MTEPARITESAPARHKMFDTSTKILLALCIAAAIGVGFKSGPMRIIEISGQYLGLLALLSPKILCGFFIAAALPILIPPETLVKWVGTESGARGLLLANLAGCLVPGGPMMIFPLAASFCAAGASSAAAVSFITAWSLYGVNRTVIWEMSFLHVDFVLLRVLICIPLPFVAGLLARALLKRFHFEARP